ncbi:MAG: four helix bundle protein [Candidatus Marinimicrobia bacterium]|nr:four helix bundle protein [Candidatus Neomarinimicrobiota bacterium]
MGTIKKFEEIEVWQRARTLVQEPYHISSDITFSKDYALKDQLRRAGISIMANIADGFGRRSSKEFANFLNISHASASEVQFHIYIAFDQNFIQKGVFNKLYTECEEISKMLLGFQNYLRKLQ